jgi:hypothetical protein
MADFYKQENDQMIATSRVTAVFHQDMFEDGLSEIKDDKLITIGFIEFRIWKNEKDFYVKKLEFPMDIVLNAPDIYKEGEYYFIDFQPNDIIIEKTMFVTSATIGAKSANGFLNLLTTAKINPEKPEDLIQIFKNATSLNGLKLKVQSSLLEAMISELTRYVDDDTIPFRIALRSNKVGMKDFKMVNIKDVARLSSVFSAISFEDIKKSLESSVLMTRNNSEQAISPVESVLKF